ncbi:MAG TPA: DUF951 domain-containing protein [Armatimonadaceae bacterium]|nr:DUF951 domain-containing protein [Armatimonadaceae bacterium]
MPSHDDRPAPALPTSVQPGDMARLRKAHPCGGREWRVTRIGADIGLECLTCGRRVMLTRDEFERRCVHREPAPADGVG